ncbi:MAG: hypothetical protein D4R70_05855 [Betaproteobacteria bacterium]|nr:MAG: hypothetical protein D4R70_05855 [Betaproteobacteria bacterium]
MRAVEAKLTRSGFTVVGGYSPQGLANYGVIVVTDPDLSKLIAQFGGATIVGAGIRVGVRNDGTVSYINPEYWQRAYLRKHFNGGAGGTVNIIQGRLQRALGAGKPFGGEVDKRDLPDYQYMFGMESFESDKNLVGESLSFADMVKTIQANLARGVGHTSKVYEVVMADKKIAVFGVAMNDPKTGEGWWVKEVHDEHIAALPYEIYVVGNKAYHLFGRYRIALAWPDAGMGTFMRIVDVPQAIQDTMKAVAGTRH